MKTDKQAIRPADSAPSHVALPVRGGSPALNGRIIQAKLTIGQPDDVYEQEADRVADQVMRMPDPTPIPALSLQRRCAACEEEGLRRKAQDPRTETADPGLDTVAATLRQGGRPLDAAARSFFEPRFGRDFGDVRIHTDSQAAASARSVNALAYTVGRDVVFNAGQYAPHSDSGKRLLAHELAHVVQQGEPSPIVKSDQVRPTIQRRLVTFGTLADVNALLGLLGPRAGLTLALNAAINQVQINAVLPAAPPSPTLRARLQAIINHATQHAEVIVARGQPQVFVGAFPQPSDMTVTRVQQVDIDDVLAIEAGAPGNGVAFAMHEIEENFRAHGVVPVAGTDRFAAAHRLAETQAENPVAAELVGPGRRVAFVQVPGTIVPTLTLPLPFGAPPLVIPGSISPVANTTATFFDYENYYLGVSRLRTAATQDTTVTNAQRFAKFTVSARTIDNFVSGSNAIPAAGAALIAAAAADVAANPTSTVLVQGFTDNVGGAAGNRTRSQQRADAVSAQLQVAGVGQLRIHAEGLGAVNFVAPNATAPDRARNRRVVITVTRPQL
jgi:outer membrane protein OmpA-like peptidoglycan-associated protein